MKKIVIATIAALAVSSTLMAAGAPANCAGCHGVDGSKNTIAKDFAPNKLSAAEITSALKAYKTGARNVSGKGAMMKGFATPLTDAQIADVAKAWGKK